MEVQPHVVRLLVKPHPQYHIHPIGYYIYGASLVGC